MRPWPALLPLLYASSAFAWVPATGRVVVVNNSGVDLKVKLPDRSSETLPAGRRLIVDLPAGDAVIKASYRQFQLPVLLERNRVNVIAGSLTTVVLDPEDDARVWVTNATAVEADVLVGGMFRAHLLPGAATVVATTPGVQTLALVAAGGRTLATTRMDLRPYAEPTWTVDRVATASLVVTNPLPIPVRVVAEGRASRVVDAGQRVVFDDLPLGGVRLTATRLSGEAVDDDVFTLRWGEPTAWRIDPPRTGLVIIDSDHGRPTSVSLDGWNMGAITPWGETRVELPLGWVRLVVTDDRGMRVEDDWVEVRPFEVVRMTAACGGPSRPQRPPPGWDSDGYAGRGGPVSGYGHGHHDDDRDPRDDDRDHRDDDRDPRDDDRDPRDDDRDPRDDGPRRPDSAR